MTDKNFRQLKEIKTPEKWIENAINIPQKKNNRNIFIFRPYVIGTAASLLAAVALGAVLYFTLGNNNTISSSPLQPTQILFTNPSQPYFTTPDGDVYTTDALGETQFVTNPSQAASGTENPSSPASTRSGTSASETSENGTSASSAASATGGAQASSQAGETHSGSDTTQGDDISTVPPVTEYEPVTEPQESTVPENWWDRHNWETPNIYPDPWELPMEEPNMPPDEPVTVEEENNAASPIEDVEFFDGYILLVGNDSMRMFNGEYKIYCDISLSYPQSKPDKFTDREYAPLISDELGESDSYAVYSPMENGIKLMTGRKYYIRFYNSAGDSYTVLAELGKSDIVLFGY